MLLYRWPEFFVFACAQIYYCWTNAVLIRFEPGGEAARCEIHNRIVRRLHQEHDPERREGRLGPPPDQTPDRDQARQRARGLHQQVSAPRFSERFVFMSEPFVMCVLITGAGREKTCAFSGVNASTITTTCHATVSGLNTKGNSAIYTVSQSSPNFREIYFVFLYKIFCTI